MTARYRPVDLPGVGLSLHGEPGLQVLTHLQINTIVNRRSVALLGRHLRLKIKEQMDRLFLFLEDIQHHTATPYHLKINELEAFRCPQFGALADALQRGVGCLRLCAFKEFRCQTARIAWPGPGSSGLSWRRRAALSLQVRHPWVLTYVFIFVSFYLDAFSAHSRRTKCPSPACYRPEETPCYTCMLSCWQQKGQSRDMSRQETLSIGLLQLYIYQYPHRHCNFC